MQPSWWPCCRANLNKTFEHCHSSCHTCQGCSIEGVAPTSGAAAGNVGSTTSTVWSGCFSLKPCPLQVGFSPVVVPLTRTHPVLPLPPFQLPATSSCRLILARATGSGGPTPRTHLTMARASKALGAVVVVLLCSAAAAQGPLLESQLAPAPEAEFEYSTCSSNGELCTGYPLSLTESQLNGVCDCGNRQITGRCDCSVSANLLWMVGWLAVRLGQGSYWSTCCIGTSSRVMHSDGPAASPLGVGATADVVCPPVPCPLSAAL